MHNHPGGRGTPEDVLNIQGSIPAVNQKGAPSRPRRRSGRLALLVAIASAIAPAACAPEEAVDVLARVRATGRLVFGCDAEGGGPYAFPDPERPKEVTGFEVELMDQLAAGVGARPVFYQGQWDALLPTLDARHVDLVVNGFEL